MMRTHIRGILNTTSYTTRIGSAEDTTDSTRVALGKLGYSLVQDLLSTGFQEPRPPGSARVSGRANARPLAGTRAGPS